MNELTNLSDHDLLITLHGEVRGLRKDISDLAVGVTASIADHEVRLRLLERQVWMWSGAAGISGAILSLLAEHFLK